MSKHSPKPWESNGNDIIDADDMVVCSFGKYSNVFTGKEIEEMNANAQLIAAAPELLEAADKVVNKNVDKKVVGMDELHRAIKKAKGADE